MNLQTENRRQKQNWTSCNRTAGTAAAQASETGKPQRRADDLLRGGATKAGSLETVLLQNQLDALTEANLELEAFNATVAHDLCLPLTAINGYCQVLKQLCSDQLDESSQAYLQGVYEGTVRMKEVISGLLRLSRVADAPLATVKVDLSEIAHRVARELTAAAPQRCVTMRVAKAVTAYGDPALWRSVLDNLIGNAWKYSAGREQACIEFGVTQLSGKAVCFVRDNGPGFDMALANRIFLPCQRLPGTGVEGHGIGLATVDRIIRRHGGRVWAESTPGAGATFYFTTQ